MSDELEKLFQDLRSRTLREIVAPGAPRARAAARRRRSVAAFGGAGVVVAVVLVGIGVALRPGGDDEIAYAPAAAPSSQPPVMPEPSGSTYEPADAAAALLADRDKTPTSINATNGVVSSSYEDDMNDMPADTYAFHFFCVGSGLVNVTVKQGDSGDTVLGQGKAVCAPHDPAPLRLTIHQPTYGYLRIFAAGDAGSNGRAGFAFEFLSTTGKTTFGPSGPPYSFQPSAGALPIEASPSN